jgi:hypothetical protein
MAARGWFDHLRGRFSSSYENANLVSCDSARVQPQVPIPTQAAGSAIIGQQANPPAAAPDPRSTVELLVQLFGAVIMIVGMTIIVRQIIYRQFGTGYPNDAFRKGMYKGFGLSLLGVAVIIASTILLTKFR